MDRIVSFEASERRNMIAEIFGMDAIVVLAVVAVVLFGSN